jgi:transcriptional regulator with XRE-family HTH domain
MKMRNISNADFARYFSINERTVVKWANDPFALSLRQLTQIAGFLNISLHYLNESLMTNSAHPDSEKRAAAMIEADKIRFNV